jgi:hypothetical protein
LPPGRRINVANLSYNPQCLPSLRDALATHPRRLAWAVGIVSLVVFGWDLPREPHFVDESAYISQSFYADLLIDGKRDDPTWLEYAGFDLPPLPKYLIGLALRLEGYPRPGPSAARSWYGDTSRRFVSDDALTAARHPSVLFGAMGCVAIFALGTLAVDARVGLFAAIALMANPLYRMHARRAMSDMPSEAMILAAAAMGLWAWKRLLAGRPAAWPTVGVAIGAGICAGLAVLAKLNGALAGFILAGWAALGLVLPSFSLRSRLTYTGSCVMAAGFAFALFVALNPFLTARPRRLSNPALVRLAGMGLMERVEVVKDHRVQVSEQAKQIFPNDALRGPFEKIKAVAVQGFGRFGPFGPRGWTDSTRRFDRKQDSGGLVWLPWVMAGFVASLAIGRRQYRRVEPPTAWAIALQAVIALATVTSFIPLAWDRYFLSIQPGSALLAAIALVAALDGIGRSLRRGVAT